MNQQKIHFEEYELNSVRETFGRTITEADFVIHAGHSGDFFPHHMDAEWCKTQPFGQRIAHGTMTFTIGIGLTASQVNSAAFTYGYERLRFPKPVYVGDTIHTRVTIAQQRARSQAAAVRTHRREDRSDQPARRNGHGV